MPIQAASLVAERRVLTDVDPSGETWVYVRPATGREHLRRGDLIRTSYSAGGVVSDTNPVLLAQLEIWLTCGGEDGTIGNIVVVYGEDDQREFFPKKKDDYTQRQFFQELSEMPIMAFRSWHRQVIAVNEEWTFPL